MNILFMTQVLPYPLDAGPKIRSYYVLRHLAESGHRICLLSFTRESDRPEYLDHLRKYCAEIHTVPMYRSRIRDGFAFIRSLAFRSPFLVSRDWVPSFARMARKIAYSLPAFDAVHADQLWMAPYAQFVHQSISAGFSPLTVLDQHNAVFNIPKRLAENQTNSCLRVVLNLEASKMARYERDICEKFDHVVWVTDEDRQAMFGGQLSSEDNHGSHSVIPIALDLSKCSSYPRQEKARRITFIGGLHWPPNSEGIRWFHREAWPQIKERAPEALLTIVGRNPKPGFIAPTDSSIELTGYVDDIAPYLAETAVFIVPLLAGGGMRVKILDAWSCNLPVVSTKIGAEGILAKHGENLLIADEPTSFASAIIEIMKNPELASCLSRGGRKTLELHYDWRKAYQSWDLIYPCGSCT